MNTVYLLMGSNHQPSLNLQLALDRLRSMVELVKVSPVYESAPVGNPGSSHYLNAATIIKTDYDAATLKRDVLRPVEAGLGRKRGEDISEVVIDLDIALFNHDCFDLGSRPIPDPEILTRAYIALPLADVAPDYIHPVESMTLRDIGKPFRMAKDVKIRHDINLEI